MKREDFGRGSKYVVEEHITGRISVYSTDCIADAATHYWNAIKFWNETAPEVRALRGPIVLLAHKRSGAVIESTIF